MSRILVIDDDVDLCELLTDYLTPEGLQVETVHHGEQGADRALSGEHVLGGFGRHAAGYQRL